MTPPAAATANGSAEVVATVSTPSKPAAAVLGEDPLALRGPGDNFVVFPSGRLQLDGYAFAASKDTPNDGFFVRRARVEATGWITRWVYFSIAGEYAASPVRTTAALASTPAPTMALADDYVAVAAWRELATLQVGQFDAPFSLENRTSDRYLDFMERSLTVRAVGVPDNKEVGAMIHGYDRGGRFLYSYGVFDGDGPGRLNLDHQFDSIGRAWLAPFAFASGGEGEAGGGPLRNLAVGGSFWLGDRENTLPLAAQTTQGGEPFADYSSYTATPTGTNGLRTVQLRQVGLLRAIAGEIDVPVRHRFDARAEVVWRHSPLSEVDVTDPNARVILGGANLIAWAGYAQLSFWLMGDDRVIGERAGVEPFVPRLRTPVWRPARGLMIALRGERVIEHLSYESDAASRGLVDPTVGATRVTSLQVGVNYWESRRFRATVNYAFYHFDGDTLYVQQLASPNAHEIAFRLAVAL
jgi:phosphate-selective porin OprO/OprP